MVARFDPSYQVEGTDRRKREFESGFGIGCEPLLVLRLGAVSAKPRPHQGIYMIGGLSTTAV